MAIPGQKRERIWHDPPMVDVDPQVQATDAVQDNTQRISVLTEFFESPQWYFYMAFFSIPIIGATYAMLKWYPGMSPEEVAVYMATVPAYFLFRGALKILLKRMAKKIQ